MLQEQQIADQRAQRQRLRQILREHPRARQPIVRGQLQQMIADPIEHSAQHEGRDQHEPQPRDPVDQIIVPAPTPLCPRRHAACDPVFAEHKEQYHRRTRKPGERKITRLKSSHELNTYSAFSLNIK